MESINESSFKFSEPSVTRLNFVRNQLDSDYSIENSAFSIEIDSNTTEFNDSERYAKVELTIEIGKNGTHPFNIGITLEAFFNWDDSFNADKVTTLLKHNAASLLYGYARQIIFFMTSHSGYPPLHIPFADFSI